MHSQGLGTGGHIMFSAKGLTPQQIAEGCGLEYSKLTAEQQKLAADILERVTSVKSSMSLQKEVGGSSTKPHRFPVLLPLRNRPSQNTHTRLATLFRATRPNTSPPFINPLHTETQALETGFSLLRDDQLSGISGQQPQPAANSCIWGFWSGNQMQYRTEYDVGTRVLMVVGEIAESYNMDVTVQQEVSVLDFRPNLWLVLSSGRPTGLIEVNKPSCLHHPSVMRDPRAHGQVHDYITLLNQYFRVVTPFVLLATYHEFCVFWPPSSSDIAASDCLPARPTSAASSSSSSSSFSSRVPNHMPHYAPSTLLSEAKPDPQPADVNVHSPQLFCSRVYNAMEPDTPKFLASVMRKMIESPLAPLDRRRHAADRLYLFAGPDAWQWRTLPENFQLQLSSFPHANTKGFFLLHDLRGGRDGRVWHAATVGGSSCVLKFGLRNKDALEREAIIWRDVWRLPARVVQLAEHHALVMPYVQRCTDEQLKEKSVQQAAEMAVNTMAAYGYLHDEAIPRHLGLYRDDQGALCAVLFDLTGVSRTKTPSESRMAMIHSLLGNHYQPTLRPGTSSPKKTIMHPDISAKDGIPFAAPFSSRSPRKRGRSFKSVSSPTTHRFQSSATALTPKSAFE